MKLDLPWEKDLSVNRYRFGRSAPGQRHRARRDHVRAWHESVVWQIRDARIRQHAARTGRNMGWKQIPKPRLPMRVQVWYRWPDRRRRDPDNVHKVIGDAIKVAIGVDDCNFLWTDEEAVVDRENPGFTIRIPDVFE
uniref:Putative endodeoxyribonuclease n=1 Tax=viral metagenome TaxID=1070528 RepID=A0A6M3X555_9ZZZZ